MAASATPADQDVQGFIQWWERSGAAERANYAMFLTELCALLSVSVPEPTRDATAAELSRRFKSAKADRVGELLATLTTLGQARSLGGDRFVA